MLYQLSYTPEVRCDLRQRRAEIKGQNGAGGGCVCFWRGMAQHAIAIP